MGPMSEEKRSSIVKPLGILLLLAGGLAGAYYWWDTRPVPYHSPQGFKVDLPKGWIATAEGEKMTMKAHVDYPEGGGAIATAVLFPNKVADPRDGLSVKGPDEYESTTIDGKSAAIAVYTEEGRRYLEVVLLDKGFLRFIISCDKRIFEKHRASFENIARSIKWPI